MEINTLPNNIEKIIAEFQVWYETDAHKNRENDYAGQLSESSIKGLESKQPVEFFYKFAKDGGGIQSGDNRTAGFLHDTIKANPEAFRKFILAPFAPDFNVSGWLHQLKSFKGWGQGIATIFLNHLPPEFQLRRLHRGHQANHGQWLDYLRGRSWNFPADLCAC